jgi:hypothetical protein
MRWNRGLTLHQLIGLPLRICRQGRKFVFIQSPSCKLQKKVNRYLIGGNGRFSLKLALGNKRRITAEGLIKIRESNLLVLRFHANVRKSFLPTCQCLENVLPLSLKTFFSHWRVAETVFCQPPISGKNAHSALLSNG